mgnify:CR=1 FL=1
MSNKFYAVYEGHMPGIYESNTEFTKQQKGYHKPSGKSFSTREEAEKALEDYNFKKESLLNQNGRHTSGTKTKIESKGNHIGLPEEYSQFIACVLLHLLIPLIPLLLEYIVVGHLSTKTLTLIAAIYSISIGRTTNNVAQFAISILISLIFSACYGITVKSPIEEAATTVHAYETLDIAALFVIAAIFILHALERYNKHVLDMVPFLNLKKD